MMADLDGNDNHFQYLRGLRWWVEVRGSVSVQYYVDGTELMKSHMDLS